MNFHLNLGYQEDGNTSNRDKEEHMWGGSDEIHFGWAEFAQI